MTIKADWDDELSHTIHMAFPAHWTVADLDCAIQNIEALRDEDDDPSFHLIVEIPSLSTVPNGFVDYIRQFSPEDISPCLGVVVIGANRLAKLTYNMLQPALPYLMSKVYFANTLEEGRMILLGEASIMERGERPLWQWVSGFWT